MSAPPSVVAAPPEWRSDPDPVPPTRLAGPLTARSDFQKFAELSAGESLPVYGRRLFEEVPSTFSPLSRTPVPANYPLGPGDELLIRVWGKIDLDSRVTVDRNGQIFLPRIGVLSVAGVRYEQLAGYLRSAVGALYKDFELNATLGKLRSIQIYVLGSVRQPGSYTVGAMSTLVDALFACGGPSANGTMRHIQLRRNNRVLTDLDVYDLLQKGDTSRDAQLLGGDVIYIPPAGPQMAVAGSVNLPGIYELSGETTVAAALAAAGGLTNLAAADRVVLERIEDHRGRRAEEFALDATGLGRPLLDGDVLRVFPISPQFENTVTLRGNVARPGRYVLRAGMRVSDLIPSRAFLLTRAYWIRQNALVFGDDHPFGAEPERSADIDISNPSPPAPETPRATKRFSGLDSQRDPAAAKAGGSPSAAAGDAAGDNAGGSANSSRPSSPNETDDAGKASRAGPTGMVSSVAANNAEINWEYAVIERLDKSDLSTRLISFHLGRVIEDPTSPDNQMLAAGDVVTIFSRRDIPLPVSEHASFVRIGGEVVAPGIYRVDSGETLRGAVSRAGGLTPQAYLYASQLLRVSTRRLQEEQLKRSIDQMSRDLIAAAADRGQPVSGGAPTNQANDIGAREMLLGRLAAVQPTGRVVLDMQPNADSAADIPGLPLEDGDSFYVPPRLGTIQVAGAVYNENAFRYQRRRPLSAYLNDAGGPTREADVKRVFLIRADGTVVSRQNRDRLWRDSFEHLRLLPGDAIVVPAKLKSPGGMRVFEEITSILSQTVLTAAALSVVAK